MFHVTVGLVGPAPAPGRVGGRWAGRCRSETVARTERDGFRVRSPLAQLRARRRLLSHVRFLFSP